MLFLLLRSRIREIKRCKVEFGFLADFSMLFICYIFKNTMIDTNFDVLKHYCIFNIQ